MDDDAAGWHEAGHALVAHLLGGEVRLVTLESELDDHEGHVEVVWRGGSAEDRARRDALVALGGPLAELWRVGRHQLEDPEVLRSWARDWQVVEDALRVLADDPTDAAERERLYRELVGEVQQQLEDPEVDEKLARIADMLLAHETLDETLFEDAVA